MEYFRIKLWETIRSGSQLPRLLSGEGLVLADNSHHVRMPGTEQSHFDRLPARS
jgi:hypothetical protein